MSGWAPRLLNDSVCKASAYSQTPSPAQRLNQQPSSSSDLRRLPVALGARLPAGRDSFAISLPKRPGGGRAPRVCLGRFGTSWGGREGPRTALLPLQRLPPGSAELTPMLSITKHCQKYRCLPVCDINWDEGKQNSSVKSQSYSHLSSRNRSEMQAKGTAAKSACKKRKNTKQTTLKKTSKQPTATWKRWLLSKSCRHQDSRELVPVGK